MVLAKAQSDLGQKTRGSLASFTRAVNALVGTQQVLDDYSSAAAHYNGLIDIIERAGWDISKLEKVKHTLDETAQRLLGDLTESLPDMSRAEEQSFLAPFHNAIHQFARMTEKEKLAFKTEYDRFAELHTKSLQELASADIA
jgi:hypothetical protein